MKTFYFNNLEDLSQHQQAAFAQSETISFDLSFPWFANFISTALKPNERIKISVSEDDGGQVVVLPMCFEDGTQRPKTIRSLSSFYTALFAPIGPGSNNVELLTFALSALKQDTQSWDVINFMPMDGGGEHYSTLKNALSAIGMLSYDYCCFGNWYLPVRGRSYTEYYQTLPSRLKNTIKRKRNLFFSKDAGKLEIITSGDRLEPGIAAYQKVYSTSWKVQEPFPEFIPGLIRLSAEQGWLRLGIAYLQGEPIAAQIWIVAHRRASIFKLAYDEKFASYSAGSILSAHMMEYALDVDKVEEVDYLIGDDPYKKDWMSHRRERMGIIAFNPRTIWGLLGYLRQTLVGLRQVLISLSIHNNLN
ncbi:hypothetical protein MTYM_01892 [Methylococcales bacterium]|nr:hypothetical protein MTYM_01892 [Methylococcales bacterium]